VGVISNAAFTQIQTVRLCWLRGVTGSQSNMKDQDIRWDSTLSQNFKRAFQQLSAAVKLAEERHLSDLEQQGLIQAFEFTHNWRGINLKDFLESPRHRQDFRLEGCHLAAAFTAGLIADGPGL